jgi:hypothetical protein
VTTTSHSSRTPRLTASTGSKLRPTSTQAAIDPAACASATVRRASVVLPLEPAPRRATLAERGRPPGPRIPSSVAKPVETTPPRGTSPGSSMGSSSGRGAVASAPTTSPMARRGAAAPHRDWRVASAAATSGGRVAIVISVSNICSI